MMPVLLLRRSEARLLLGVTESQYKHLLRRGKLREIAIGARGKRLPVAEAERFLGRRVGPIPLVARATRSECALARRLRLISAFPRGRYERAQMRRSS